MTDLSPVQKINSTDLSPVHPGGAVQPQINVAVVVEESFQHVQHPGHLGEDESPVTSRLQLAQQRVQGLKLACDDDAIR